TDAIPAGGVPLGHRGDLIDGVVERSAARRPRPELDGRVEQEPDDLSLILLVLAHEQLAPSRRGLPGDALEGVARLVLAQLAQLAAVARKPTAAPGLGAESVAPAATGPRKHAVRPRHHVDAERIGEGQRHLEQPGATAHLEREPVDAVTAHTRPPHPNGHREPPSSGHLSGARLDADA